MRTSPESPGYLALLTGNRDFRNLWLGVVISFFGDWFSTIALYTLVQELSDSGRALAGVMIAKTLPMFLVAPIAGTLVDRFDRRLLLIGADIARAVMTLAVLGGWWMQSLPLVFTALVIRMSFTGLFVPARTAALPQLTNSRELPVAVALDGGTWSVMLAFGAAIGGVVTALLGVTGALLVDGATFLLSAVFLWRLPPIPPREAGDTTPVTFRQGLAWLQGQVYLPALLCLKAGQALAAGAIVVLPIFGNGLFPLAGPLWVGGLFAARGMGALFGSVGVRRLSGDAPRVLRQLIAPAYLVGSAALVMLASAPQLGWAAAGILLAGAGNGVVWVYSGILAQQVTPRSYRGRLFALEWGVMTLVSASSSYAAGWAMDVWGASARDVVFACGLMLTLPALAWFGVVALAPDVRDDAREASPVRA